jgi:predicted glycoside hydrolase/deacetylase ChbG (UPF0249 family)
VRVIVNADDFGLSEDTVAATIACIEEGSVTSATIMPGAPAAERALAFARSCGGRSFGVHLTLVGDGYEAPLSDPASVPSLVDRAGHLRSTNRVRAAALFGTLDRAEVGREIRAQIEAVRCCGVEVSHVDSHRHLHKWRVVRAALADVLGCVRIERVRGVQDVYLRRPLASPTYWLGRRWRRAIDEQFLTTDHFYMPGTAGDAGWLALLPWMERQRDDETLEIGVHPGTAEDWRRSERQGAAEFARVAAEQGHVLVDWRAVARPALTTRGTGTSRGAR